MARPARHAWDLVPSAARELQSDLSRRLRLEDEPGPVGMLAGVDCGFEDHGRVTRAAVVVMHWPSLEVVDQALARLPTTFPYVPGLLSFREMPAILAAVAELSCQPDLFLCDGQGIAHPRRFGIACHLGLWLDRPAVGVAKSRLTGTFSEPGPGKGDWKPLRHQGETIGSVLRSRDRVRPLFVSPGHRVSVAGARRWALAATTRYRLPEPVRAADRLASNRGAGPGQ